MKNSQDVVNRQRRASTREEQQRQRKMKIAIAGTTWRTSCATNVTRVKPEFWSK